MIRCALGEIMNERKLKNKDVVEMTGVSRNTITTLAADATKRIDYDTLNKLCKGLGLEPKDLIIFEPDNDKEEPTQ